MSEATEVSKYPLLEEILSIVNLPLKATYTNRDVAKIFGVSTRAIQDRVSSGQFVTRDLPGRAKFLSTDLEAFLLRSTKMEGK